MRALRRVGVAASSEYPELDAGWPELRAALTAAGLDPVVVAWDQESAGGGTLDLVIVNYRWGYVTRVGAFLAWAERTAARSLVMNPLPVLRWNSDKVYLGDLAAAGVPTVPTQVHRARRAVVSAGRRLRHQAQRRQRRVGGRPVRPERPASR